MSTPARSTATPLPASWDGSFGIDELNNYDNKNLDDKTFDLYLDQYGYLIGIEQVEDDVEYVFITSYEITSKYMTNRTAKATRHLRGRHHQGHRGQPEEVR